MRDGSGNASSTGIRPSCSTSAAHCCGPAVKIHAPHIATMGQLNDKSRLQQAIQFRCAASLDALLRATRQGLQMELVHTLQAVKKRQWHQWCGARRHRHGWCHHRSHMRTAWPARARSQCLHARLPPCLSKSPLQTCPPAGHGSTVLVRVSSGAAWKMTKKSSHPVCCDGPEQNEGYKVQDCTAAQVMMQIYAHHQRGAHYQVSEACPGEQSQVGSSARLSFALFWVSFNGLLSSKSYYLQVRHQVGNQLRASHRHCCYCRLARCAAPAGTCAKQKSMRCTACTCKR